VQYGDADETTMRHVAERPQPLEQWRSGLARWARRIIAPRSVLPALDLPATCDAVFGRIAQAGSWEDLRHCATELRFLSLHADRLIEATRVAYGDGAEIRVANAALVRMRRDLDAVWPVPRYPRGFCQCHAQMRNTLYDAVGQLRYGLLVLTWARAGRHRRPAASA
jgi:hypothetical protein